MGEGLRGGGAAAAAVGCPLSSELVERLRAAGCVFAEDEARLLLEAASGAELNRLVERRVTGEPLEYVLGWVEFDAFRYAVEPGVFVPRQRTELLVREAARIGAELPEPIVVDLCCGCGALGVAVLRRLGRGTLLAADLEPAAVRCAARNVEPVGGQVLLGDLFDPLPSDLRGQVDLLLANVPYVPTDAIALMPPEAREHEPRTSLDGGPDGLSVFARVAAQAGRWLAPRGSVLIETSEAQVPEATRVLTGGELAVRVVADEEAGATVIVGAAPARMAT